MNTIRVKQWMIGKGLKQADIAKKLGVSRPYVSLTIAGKKKPGKVGTFLANLGCPKKFIY